MPMEPAVQQRSDVAEEKPPVVMLVSQVQLCADEETRQLVVATIERINEACGWLSLQAWEHRAWGKRKLQQLAYKECREKFFLSAQVTVRAIAKVADAYKSDYARTKKRTFCEFEKDGAVAYDDRILSWNIDQGTVSIWTLGGRRTAPFVVGGPHAEWLKQRKGESDLMVRDGKLYLAATCQMPQPAVVTHSGVLGVDRGIVNIATTSSGTNHSGAHMQKRKARYDRMKARLQSKGTKSAKRLLKKTKRRERRFVKDTNHKISYRVVREAERTGSAIAMEDLSGIRNRVRVRRPQRRSHHNWSFYELESFITYKALLKGVPTVFVDPRNTSRRCPMCHHTSKGNRPTRDLFRCQCCGLAGPADLIAAVNIAFLGSCDLGRGEATRPHAGAQACRSAHGTRHHMATLTPQVLRDTTGSRPGVPHAVLPASSAL